MFISPPPESDDVRRVYESSVASQGFLMNLTRAWAWRPEVFEGFAALRGQLTNNSALSKRDLAVLVSATAATLGDAYCALACPYQARYKIDGVATKCTFCVERIDAGTAKGLTPGVDPEATPACVNSCIANALHFGDADDPASNISRLLAENQHFRMHEGVGTGPNFYYLWDRAP